MDMDGGRARKLVFRISIRSGMLIIAVCALLLMPVIWTIRQSWLMQKALDRAIAAEQAAARAQAEAEQARAQVPVEERPAKDPAVARAARRHPRDPKDAERVHQLYREIDSLTRIQEKVGTELQGLRARSTKGAARPESGAP